VPPQSHGQFRVTPPSRRPLGRLNQPALSLPGASRTRHPTSPNKPMAFIIAVTGSIGISTPKESVSPSLFPTRTRGKDKEHFLKKSHITPCPNIAEQANISDGAAAAPR